jgi:hypothetical protein
MIFTIHKEGQPAKVIRMGYGAMAVPSTTADKIESVTLAPEVNKKPGRVKKMAEEKKLGQETGVEKLSQERADKQGPVGTSNQPPPREAPAEDVKIGNKGDEKND